MRFTLNAIFLINIIAVVNFAQDIHGIWLIQEQYRDGFLVFNKPYMKYEFTLDGTWNVRIK